MHVYMCVRMFMRMYVCCINLISIQIVQSLNFDIFTSKIIFSGTKIDDIAGIGDIGTKYVCIYVCKYVYACVYKLNHTDTSPDRLEIEGRCIYMQDTSFQVKNWRFGRGVESTVPLHTNRLDFDMHTNRVNMLDSSSKRQVFKVMR